VTAAVCACAVGLVAVLEVSSNSEACDDLERVWDAEVMRGECRSKDGPAQGTAAGERCAREGATPLTARATDIRAAPC
jgi:hypothetical protein